MSENNEAKMIKKSMKKDFNKLGITLIAQEIIANAVIFIVFIGAMLVRIIKDRGASSADLEQMVKNPSYLGLLSIFSVIIAFIPILIYRGNKFFQYDLKVENKKFTLKTVIIGFIFVLAVNNALGLFAAVLESGLNLIGLSAASALEDLEILNQSTISMIIYTCIIAPIFEELLYRGAVLRSFEKYGRRFAILISAILFGLMHGNFYQIFMAAGIGIILGYLATEYSIKLTIILHIINNTFVELTTQFGSNVNENVGNIMNISMIGISLIILIAAFIRNRNFIKEWLENNRMGKKIMLRFFTSITIIIIVAVDFIMVVSGIKTIS
ncbi:CAAX amino terminal protease self- immunity [Clostridium puniceum]|uniref:CAAX amino terminal protease self-immunity n=1 Tax=Clostridium puniceum TaxID=29367 RepID=A0A1S8T065_9CLOT|nr:CPBP family intramembrane glutamic endopeptidase [Clostridium puniceum]OOM70875.1 CAAX amino terminal protease self- immunity [Clostridium puniceum]